MGIQTDDMIVGVLYGDRSELSSNYKAIDAYFPVFCGSEFWAHLTGDTAFYHRLSKAFGEVVEEDGIDGSLLIQQKVKEIAKEISDNGGI